MARRRVTEFEIRTRDSTSAEVKRINTAFDSLTVGTRALEGPLGQIAGRLTTVSTGFTRLNPLVFGAATGVAALVAGVAQSIRVFSEFEQQQFRIQALLQATGETAGFTGDQFIELARDVDRATLASDTAARDAIGQLLTFTNVTGERFTRTIRLAQDFAAVFGGDITNAIQRFGRALDDPSEGLELLARNFSVFRGEVGDAIKELDNSGRLLEAQERILEVVEARIGGAGAGEARGLAGAFDRLKFELRDIGVALAEDSPFTFGFQRLLERLSQAVRLVNDLTTGGTLADAIREARIAAEDSGIADVEGVLGLPGQGGAAMSAAEQEVELLNAIRLVDAQRRLAAQQREREFREEQERQAAFVRNSEERKNQIRELAALATRVNKERTEAEKEAEREREKNERNLQRSLDKAAQNRERIFQQLEREILLFDASRQAVAEYDLSLNKAGLSRQQFENVLKRARALTEQIDQLNAARERSERLRDAVEDVGFTFVSAFEEAILKTRELDQILQGLIQDIAQLLLRQAVTRPLATGIAGIVDNFFNPTTSGGGLPGGGRAQSGLDFIVGGSGGTDSQRLGLDVTPGERVRVETPAQQRAGEAAVVNNFNVTINTIGDRGVRETIVGIVNDAAKRNFQPGIGQVGVRR